MGPRNDVAIRVLAPSRWPEAGALAGRAFWTEDYMGVLAEDLLERFAVVQDLYLGMQLSDSTTTLAAFAGDHVVGVACVERGDCFFCALDPDAEAPDDHVGAVMHGVDQAIRRLHAGLPAHANIGPVAVEPTLQGNGIGVALVEAAYELAASGRPPTVAIDCDPRLQSFYEGRGFVPIGTVTDPWGFDIVGLRRDPPRSVP
jgi:GNAT superfamily N-acetyltransferase